MIHAVWTAKIKADLKARKSHSESHRVFSIPTKNWKEWGLEGRGARETPGVNQRNKKSAGRIHDFEQRPRDTLGIGRTSDAGRYPVRRRLTSRCH
jgi:hypothetical protein